MKVIISEVHLFSFTTNKLIAMYFANDLQLRFFCIKKFLKNIFRHVSVFLDVLIAAQRKIGETSLNERSSRSHQIIKLVKLFPITGFKAQRFPLSFFAQCLILIVNIL